MAVTLLRLYDPTQQLQLKGGQLNVAGRLYVHYADTDDLADVYDEDGTQLSQPVILDNNGRAAGLFVDASRVYWLDVQDKDGMSQFTIRKMTPCGGGGGSLLPKTYDIVSSDGSIAVDKSTEDNTVTYDLSMREDSKDILEWIRCDGGSQVPNTDIYTPFYTSGTMRVATRGVQLYRDRYYHVTAHVSANKPSNASPWYDDVDVKFVLDYGGGSESVVVQKSCIVDYSISQSQDYEISADVHPTSNAELLIEIAGGETGNTFTLSDVEVHRVYSGVPYIPGEWLERIQSDWTEDDISKVSYIQHKPDLSVYATNAALTAGLATKQDVISDLQTIRDGAALGATAVQDANYVHTDNNFTTTLKDKLDGIAAGAEVNVQSNWTETDTSSDAYIQNKPSLATVATSGSYSDLTNKPNLATVATSGSYNDLTNKPTIPAAQVNSDWDAASGVAAISNKPTFQNEADTTTTIDSNTPLVVGYNSTSKKLVTRLVSALMSFLGISVSGSSKSFSGTADTADKVNYDTITSGNAYIPAFDHNGKRLKVVAGNNGLIMQKASDSDYALINCKSALAADADHAANSDTVSNHTVGTDVPASADFIGLLTTSNSFTDVKNLVDAGILPVFVETVSDPFGNSTTYRYTMTSYAYTAGRTETASFSRTEGSTVKTYTVNGVVWTPSTTTVPASLSAGNGISISSNTVSAKLKSSGGINVDSNGLYVDAHYVSYDASQGLSTANQMNARHNINALTRAQFTDFSNTMTLERTGRTFLDNNVVWAGNSPRHTWKGLWSIVVPAHCYMLWSIGGQLRIQESSQTEWAISLNEDSDSYPTSELYSTYFMSNGSSNLSTNLPGIWHHYSSGLNQHTVYIGMYNSSEAVPSTGAALYGKIYAPAGDGQRKTGPWFTYFIMEAANIKADE